jgi:hypothetical protein
MPGGWTITDIAATSGGLLHWAAFLLALSDFARDPAHWRKTEHGAVQAAAA